MVADAPSFAEVWEPLADIAEGSVIVCHNAMFDTDVLCSCLAHYGLKMPECRYCMHGKGVASGYGLSWKIINWIRYPTALRHRRSNHHEAGSDARAAGLILQAALRRTGSADADALAEKIGMRHRPDFLDGENAVQHRRGPQTQGAQTDSTSA